MLGPFPGASFAHSTFRKFTSRVPAPSTWLTATLFTSVGREFCIVTTSSPDWSFVASDFLLIETATTSVPVSLDSKSLCG